MFFFNIYSTLDYRTGINCCRQFAFDFETPRGAQGKSLIRVSQLQTSVDDCIWKTTSTSDCTTHLVFMFSHILSCIYILMFCLTFCVDFTFANTRCKIYNFFCHFSIYLNLPSNPFHLLFSAGLLHILSSRGFHPQQPTCLRSLVK